MIFAVVGSYQGHFSRAVVTRGIYQALWSARGLEHEVQAVDVEDGPQDLTHCDAAIYVCAYPPQIFNEMAACPCRKTVGLFITESATVPDHWRTITRAVDLAYAPSGWAASAFGQHCRVLHHGVANEFFTPLPELRPRDRLRFLHVAGAASFLARKGTYELLEAFKYVYGSAGSRAGQAELVLRVQPTPEAVALVAARPWAQLDPAVEGLAPADMARLYRSYSCVVQPSRAEAFGLVPLEAAHAGVPVIATRSSGHAAYFDSIHAIMVDASGPPAPIRVNGCPSGQAPTVSVPSLILALLQFHEQQESRIELAHDVARTLQHTKAWTWEHTTLPLLNDLKELVR